MPKHFTKCFLHIGTEKTGTTTLQMFLGTNRALLARRGYLVPKSLSPYQVLANHERLTTISLEVGKLRDDLRRAAGLKTADDVIAHRARVRDDFTQEIHQAACVPPNLLLSNEHCHSRLTLDSEVRALYDFLSEFADDFELAVYLRPQHELATSLYDQALKAGYADIDVLPAWEGNANKWVERKYFDYDDLTSRWERVFGPNRLKPRIYARDELVNNSIIDDFLKGIGCDGTGMVAPKDANKSISSELQLVLNTVNRYARAHPERVTRQHRVRLIDALQRLSNGSGRRPTRSEAANFYQKFVASNQHVRQRYFPQRACLFSPNFEAFPEFASDQPLELDALLEALLAVVVQ